MRHVRWSLLTLLIVTPLLLLAVGFRPPWLGSPRLLAQPRPVPPGDQEMAWIHTTTNGTTWERFVTGLKRVEMLIPGVHVDDAEAFLDQSTAIPEVVISRDGRDGKLRVRWYKITSDVTTSHWIRALSMRDPAPLAFIGGGSSDRALELAKGLNRQTDWHGDRPLLLITTATADEVYPEPEDRPPGAGPIQPPRLIDVYDDCSFRFCFTNRQMADAVTDFVFADPTLRPGPITWPGLRMIPLAATGGWGMLGAAADYYPHASPDVFAVAWQDDPYSMDLSDRFKDSIRQHLRKEGREPALFTWNVPFSVGSFYAPNRHEAESVDAIVQDLPPPGERSLLVLPTTPPPARRFLRTLLEASPLIDRRMVAITGDGIGMNVIYRDGEFAWPVRWLSIPLVLFTHHNPFAWDEPGASPKPPAGYELRPPNTTEDALHFTELGRLVVEAAFPSGDDGQQVPQAGGLVTRADHLAARLHGRSPPFFDAQGNRNGGTGEYIVVVRPTFEATVPIGGKPPPDATIDVYLRAKEGTPWHRIRTLPLVQTRRPDGRPPE